MLKTETQVLLLKKFLKENHGETIKKSELIHFLFEVVQIECPKYARTDVLKTFVLTGFMIKVTNKGYYIRYPKPFTAKTLKFIIEHGIETTRKKNRIFYHEYHKNNN